MRRFLALGMALVCACGGDDDNEGVTDGPRIRFEIPDAGLPAPGQVPFPTDMYLTDADGTIVDTLTDWTRFGVEMAQPSAMFQQYGALNGFGVQSAILFGVAGLTGTQQIDPASLTADRFVLIDTAVGTPLPVTAGYDGVAKAITVLPVDPLLSGHTYAVGVLKGPKVIDGVTLGADKQFGTLRDGGTLDGAGTSYADAIMKIAATGANRDDLIAVTELTTHHEQEKAINTAARLFAGEYGPEPELNLTPTAPITATKFGRTTHAGWTATLDEWLGTAKKLPASGSGGPTDLPGFPEPPEAATVGIPHDAIAAIVTGSILSPQFPRSYNGSAAYDDGTTAYDTNGNAVAASTTTDIPVMIVLPASAAPQGGYPVVIFQHGLGGDRFDALAIANELARGGYATVAIDAPLHGMRDSTLADVKSNGPGTFTGPDGFADTSDPIVLLHVIGEAKSVLRARDNLWQWSFDLVSLRRMIDTVDLTVAAPEFGGTAPALNMNKVALVAWSMGGLTGTTFAALAADGWVDPVVLTSPASNIGLLIGGSPVYAAQATLLAGALNIRGASLDAGSYSAVLQLFEGLASPADTGTMAPIAASQHNLWVLAAEQDESVPHASVDQLVRSMGGTQLMPNVRQVAGVTQVASPLTAAPGQHVTGFFEVSPGNHGHTFERWVELDFAPPYPRDEEPRFVDLPAKIHIRSTVVGEQRAITAFIASVFAGAPKIDVTDAAFIGLAPVSDFDDDGACDADEMTAGTDPLNPSSVPSGAKNCVRNLGFTLD